MNNSAEVKTAVRQFLQTLPVCIPSSNLRNWTVRCPFCGDSHTINHGHLSILLDIDSDSPMFFRCFKCNESGVVTPDLLEMLAGFIPTGLKNDITQFNKKGSRKIKISSEPMRFKIPPTEESANTIRHLNYINDRLGTNLSFEDCENRKIILDFSEFLRYNHLVLNGMAGFNNVKTRSIDTLSKDYVGFLSLNRNKITFRDTTPDNSGFFGRYYKVPLCLTSTNTDNFYSAEYRFDLTYAEPIDIHIAEGTFDILGVMYNLDHEPSENRLYFASCGYNFNTIVKSLIYSGVTTDINLHIYADNDKSDADLKKVFRSQFFKIWVDKIIVHRNIYPSEKDFGVPRERINDKMYELKL